MTDSDRSEATSRSAGAAAPRRPDDLDLEALARWLDDAGIPGDSLPTLSRFPGGTQNELYAVQRGDRRLALRRLPSGATEARQATMRREFHILRRLGETDVPHPRLIGVDETGGVLSRPFFVMERVEGWSPAGTWPEPFASDTSARPALAFEAVDGAARLSRVDWQSFGLADFGRPDGFHDRQVDRWLAFLDRVRFRELPGLARASEWLRGHRPRVYRPGIMHGDYQFANLMFRPSAPATLAAIIDWEMATIGDPLLDLGWMLISWPPEGDDMHHFRSLDLAGMPGRSELLERYATVSGRPVDDIDYYVILARFKLAIVLEASVSRYRSGDADDRVASFVEIVPELMRKAAELSWSSAADGAHPTAYDQVEGDRPG